MWDVGCGVSDVGWGAGVWDLGWGCGFLDVGWGGRCLGRRVGQMGLATHGRRLQDTPVVVEGKSMTGWDDHTLRRAAEAGTRGNGMADEFSEITVQHFNELPIDMEAMIVADMEALGMDSALIYAFQHTGLLVTDDTMSGYTDDQLLAWQAAVDRYRTTAA